MILNNNLFLRFPNFFIKDENVKKLKEGVEEIISKIQKYEFREYMVRNKIELIYNKQQSSPPFIIFIKNTNLDFIDAEIGGFGLLISLSARELINYESLKGTPKQELSLLVPPTLILFYIFQPLLK